MAIANLQETLLSYKLRKNFLNLELSELAAQKTLAIRAQSDNQSLLSSRKHEVRDYFKALYEGDPELHEKYIREGYTIGGEIIFPDFAEGNSFKISFTIKNGSDIKKIEETIARSMPLLRESLQEIKENS